MFKIISLRGGLGNQMFSYAFYLALKHRFKLSFIAIEPIQCFLAHNGYELPDVFKNVEKKKSYKYYRRIQKIHSEYTTKHLFKKVIELSPGDFYLDYAKNISPFIFYDGYWQTEKYFNNIKNQIQQTFLFDEKKLNEKTRLQGKILEKQNSVSIHIRRGDYVEYDEFGSTVTLTYYKRAIVYLKERIKDPQFYVFTDDKEWVSNNFSFHKYNIMNWNNSADSWQDMYLMTKCKHNIIANSSFSWWGAWLNGNKEKIVIAPTKWFQTIPGQDIVPDAWIRI